MLAQSFAPIVGGEERVVEDLSRELVARGHDVSIATLQQPGDMTPTEVAGARVHTLRSTSYRITRTLRTPSVATRRRRRTRRP